MISQIIEVTFILVALFLVLQNAQGFSQAAGAVGNLYQGAVKTLQGR